MTMSRALAASRSRRQRRTMAGHTTPIRASVL
jgi:hypothetical protein